MFGPMETKKLMEGVATVITKDIGHFAHKFVGYPLRKTLGANGKAAETFANAILLYLFSDYVMKGPSKVMVKNIALNMVAFGVDELLKANNLLNFEDYEDYEDFEDYGEYYGYEEPDELEAYEEPEEVEAYEGLQVY